METHLNLSDEEFEKQFLDLTLNPNLFNHEAHIRLAWIHVKKYGINKAIRNVCQQINAFASFHGDHDKYHETLTVAAVRTVYHFTLKSDKADFISFINENQRLKTHFKALLDQHYSKELLSDPQGRLKYLAPDLLAFD